MPPRFSNFRRHTIIFIVFFAVLEQIDQSHLDVGILFTNLYQVGFGYPDQFGGPENKKFKYGPLREMLIGISDRSMEEQRQELDRVMSAWKGDVPQVDDILIFGIRFL